MTVKGNIANNKKRPIRSFFVVDSHSLNATIRNETKTVLSGLSIKWKAGDEVSRVRTSLSVEK